MLSQVILFCVSTCLVVNLVKSDILCKDATLDSIAYAADMQMYFISIGGKYWWVKENKFPIQESDAKPIPAPFTKATAAVYIDGDNACQTESRSAVGMRVNEKMIWITDVVNGQQKLMAYDIKVNQWSKEPINYDQDRCIAKARIDFASGKPIDAMFTRNYLELYLVMGDKYAMVDCKFLCSNPDGAFGSDSPSYPVTDFGTQDPIYAMFAMGNKKLLMFHEKSYYVMTVDEKQSINGRVKANKQGASKDLLTDFLTLKDPSDQCSAEAAKPSDAPPAEGEAGPPPENPEEAAQPEQPGGAESESKSDGDEEGGGFIWIVVVVVAVALIAIIAIIAFFAMRKKKPEDAAAGGAEAGVAPTGSQVSAKKSGSKVGSSTGSKMGASGSKVPNSSMATKSARSNIGKNPKPVSSVKSSAK